MAGLQLWRELSRRVPNRSRPTLVPSLPECILSPDYLPQQSTVKCQTTKPKRPVRNDRGTAAVTNVTQGVGETSESGLGLGLGLDGETASSEAGGDSAADPGGDFLMRKRARGHVVRSDRRLQADGSPETSRTARWSRRRTEWWTRSRRH